MQNNTENKVVASGLMIDKSDPILSDYYLDLVDAGLNVEDYMLFGWADVPVLFPLDVYEHWTQEGGFSSTSKFHTGRVTKLKDLDRDSVLDQLQPVYQGNPIWDFLQEHGQAGKFRFTYWN